jgi:hypothetical protein
MYSSCVNDCLTQQVDRLHLQLADERRRHEQERVNWRIQQLRTTKQQNDSLKKNEFLEQSNNLKPNDALEQSLEQHNNTLNSREQTQQQKNTEQALLESNTMIHQAEIDSMKQAHAQELARVEAEAYADMERRCEQELELLQDELNACHQAELQAANKEKDAHACWLASQNDELKTEQQELQDELMETLQELKRVQLQVEKHDGEMAKLCRYHQDEMDNLQEELQLVLSQQKAATVLYDPSKSSSTRAEPLWDVSLEESKLLRVKLNKKTAELETARQEIDHLHRVLYKRNRVSPTGVTEAFTLCSTGSLEHREPDFYALSRPTDVFTPNRNDAIRNDWSIKTNTVKADRDRGSEVRIDWQESVQVGTTDQAQNEANDRLGIQFAEADDVYVQLEYDGYTRTDDRLAHQVVDTLEQIIGVEAIQKGLHEYISHLKANSENYQRKGDNVLLKLVCHLEDQIKHAGLEVELANMKLSLANFEMEHLEKEYTAVVTICEEAISMLESNASMDPHCD